MSTATRTRNERCTADLAVFQYVQDEVLDVQSGDDIQLLISQMKIKTVTQFLNIIHINNWGKDLTLTFTDSTRPIDQVSRGKLVQFYLFNKYKNQFEDEGDEFTDWSSLQYKDFERFQARCLSESDFDQSITPRKPPSRTTTATTLTTPRQTSALAAFEKGIKRDPNAFEVLSKEKNLDSWLRCTRAEMKAQNVYNICDPNYISPTDPDDHAVDAKKQDYLYAVFHKVLKTSSGMQLITKHEKDADKATKIWSALLQHAKESTDATINAQNLLEYIMTANIANQTGSTYDFVLNWEEQHRCYIAIVGTMEAIDPATLSCILRKVVRSIPALKNVEDTVNILQKGQASNSSATALTSQQKYDNYKQLLLEACQTYDAESKTSKSWHRANCVLLHKLQHEEEVTYV